MSDVADTIRERLRVGHARHCDTQEGGSCDCGFDAWLYEQAELRAEALHATSGPVAERAGGAPAARVSELEAALRKLLDMPRYVTWHQRQRTLTEARAALDATSEKER